MKKLDQHLTPYIRINSKWVRELNAKRTKTIQALEETMMNLSKFWVHLAVVLSWGQFWHPEGVQQCSSISRDIFCSNCQILLVSSRKMFRIQLNILHCTGQIPPTKNYLAQNVIGAVVEILWNRGRLLTIT